MKRILASLLLLLFCSTQVVFAQSDTESFYIRVLGDTDVIPPTTPTMLTATPVASTQIDITWSSSTDNTIVAGYVVSRDGTPIATTSLLLYSDTGLAASTTYSYTVRAFDPLRNYSSSSNALATTTLQPPPPPPTPTSTRSVAGGTVARTVVDELRIETGISTSTFLLQTSMPARIELRWGKTTDYELGYIVSNIFRRDHIIDLADLEPGTKYQFELIGYTPSGVQTVLETGSFTTKQLRVVEPPPNVRFFEAVQNGVDVNLSWQLPVFDEFGYVRVVRSHYGFPAHPQDGALVYQGIGTSAIDGDILRHYSPVFYTVFVYDTEGNVSSGAIAVVYAVSGDDFDGIVTSTPETDPVSIGDILPGEGPTSTIDTERVTPAMVLPDLYDITIQQGDKKYRFSEMGIVLATERDFIISVPATVVSKNLKSIIVTLRDPSNHKKQYSFLLRINRNGSAYEAVIPGSNVEGYTRIVLEVYDYEAFVVGTYQNTISFEKDKKVDSDEPVLFPDVFLSHPFFWLWLLVVLLLLIFFILFLAKRRDEEDDEDNE